MKKRILSLLLTISLILSLAACGGNATTPSEAPTQSATEAAANTTPVIEADRNLLTVDITVPAEFVEEGTTQDTLDADAAQAGYISATLNADGSVTYTMTKAVHKEMMGGIRESLHTALDEMVGSEEYPTFTKITHNDDFTEFTVEISASELGLMESFSILAFYMYGGMYHAFNGTQVDDISVTFVNADTGDVIEEAHSKDAG